MRDGGGDEAQIVAQAAAVVSVQRDLLGQAVRVGQTEDPRDNVRQLLDHKVVKDAVHPVDFRLGNSERQCETDGANRDVLVLLQLLKLAGDDFALAGVATEERHRLAMHAQAGVHVAANSQL